MYSSISAGMSVLIGSPMRRSDSTSSGWSCVHSPRVKMLASSSAFSGAKRSVRTPRTQSRSWTIALRATSARMRVSSSISCLCSVFHSTALTIDAAGCCPSWGSSEPSTAFGSITISSAASAISVPPLIA